LPAQDILIKNGHIVTDRDLGDMPRADIYVSEGTIRHIGPDLATPRDALVIDADSKVVLPGLVDTHRHVWQGAIGGSAGSVSLGGYSRAGFWSARTPIGRSNSSPRPTNDSWHRLRSTPCRPS
jgi:cytosine/adenosine deaminase-related metal-dependent hydrolase